MESTTKDTLIRVFLLLSIAGMLSAMVADIYVFKKVTHRMMSIPFEEPPVAKPKKAETKIRQINGDELPGLEGFKDREGRYTPLAELKEDMPRTLRDGSTISRLEDGYGNTSVTRSFRKHPLLRMILVRIKSNGERVIYVYGRNGEVKSIPRQYWERIFSASGDELASAAQIYDSENVNDKRKKRLANIRETLVKPDEIKIEPIRKPVQPAVEENETPVESNEVDPEESNDQEDAEVDSEQ
ncbi:MAG: hypothetical protein HKN33_13235 [Pyrinomonadaceae bacterium]|nr:hypothetical protein [Pyrinomonadaceae bacterium]